MGYPQMANVIRNDDGGTLFSDKPSFSDVVASETEDELEADASSPSEDTQKNSSDAAS